MIDYPYGKENVQTAGLKAVINAMDGETVVFPYDDETPFTLGIKAILERIDAGGGGSDANKIVQLQPHQVTKRTVDRLGTILMVLVDDLTGVNNGDYIITSGYTDYTTSSTVNEALMFTLNNIDNPGEFDGDDYAWEFYDSAIVLQGANGVSPTIATTEITDGHRVTVTDVNGTRAFDVMDGADGAQIVQGLILMQYAVGQQTYLLYVTPGSTPAPTPVNVGDWCITMLYYDGSSMNNTTMISKALGTIDYGGASYTYTTVQSALPLSYTLTQQDKQDIAALVAQQYTNGDTTGY